jgi:hypothetical protein
MSLTQEDIEHAQFRATAGKAQGLGATPRDALDSLMARLDGAPETPIVIWPFNRGDKFFTDAQQQRLNDLRNRVDTLTSDERAELEQLVEASFDATIARAAAFQSNKP